jgi:hypothetical protein
MLAHGLRSAEMQEHCPGMQKFAKCFFALRDAG